MAENFSQAVRRLIDVLAEHDTTLPDELDAAFDASRLPRTYGFDEVAGWQHENVFLLSSSEKEANAVLNALEHMANEHDMPSNPFGTIKTEYRLLHRDLSPEEQALISPDSSDVVGSYGKRER